MTEMVTSGSMSGEGDGPMGLGESGSERRRSHWLYMMRRVECPRCGVIVERVPWAEGKHQLTTTYMLFLA